MNPRALFVGPDGRARAPWRLLLFVVLAFACVIVLYYPAAPLLATMERFVGIDGTAESYLMMSALLLAHWMTLRSFDRQPAPPMLFSHYSDVLQDHAFPADEAGALVT